MVENGKWLYNSETNAQIYLIIESEDPDKQYLKEYKVSVKNFTDKINTAQKSIQ